MLNSLKSGNRLRVDFAKNPQHIEIPNLLQLQQNSYDNFLMVGKDDRADAGIEKVCKSSFPIHDAQGRITLDDVVDVIREEADRDYQLASDLLQLAKTLQPTPLELAQFGSIDESSLRMKGAWEGMPRHSPPVANPRFKG